MTYCRQVTNSYSLTVYWALLAMLAMAASCVVPKKYPVNKPFVFKTSISVEGNIKNAERQDLEARLANQLDDSLKTRSVSFAGIRKTLIRPAAFDTNYANRSVLFMNALMNSLGYYAAAINWDSTLRITGRQQRVTINFTVNTGKNLRLDSTGYALTDSGLQHLALATRQASFLEKDKPYSQQIVSAELDRLIEVYRNNGYYKITREDLYAEVDTALAGLLNPGLDPFEQVRLLGELQRKREQPTINVTIRQRSKETATSLKRYRIRHVSIFPDLQLFDDSSRTTFDSVTVKGVSVFSKANKFKPGFLVKNTSLMPGELYSQADYYRTVNTYSQLGAWQQVNIAIQPYDSLGLMDVVIELYPARKQNMVIDLEATRNAGDVITTSNLFGIGVNLGFSNKNLAKESIQSTTNIRGGIELGTKTRLIQTLQGSIAQNVYFPRFILPFKLATEDRFATARTILNINTSYTDRRDLFTLGSINASIGYEWAKKRKITQAGNRETSRLWFYSPFNIELLRPGIKDSLRTLFGKVPNLQNSFTNGLIISQNLVYRSFTTRKYKNNTTFTSLRMALEESGGIFGNIRYIDRTANLYRYVKVDADLRHQIRYSRNEWAFRLYGGVGLPYGKTANGLTETSLPYTKSFFAGGPNSMRGWQVRRLGVGSNKYLDTLNGGTVDRFADIQLEGNVEFRFNIATIGGVKVKSALFGDVGNIWRRTANTSILLINSDFNVNRLLTDIAIDAGTSLRFDFSYFLIRFDWAYKIKNPAYSDINYGWLHDMRLASGQFQLGINYPF